MIIGAARLLDRLGKCRSCRCGDYTIRQLTLHPGQAFRCYFCFDTARGVGGFRIRDRVS
jgi:hypothetical protein